MYFVVSLIPFLVGLVYYSKFLFGNSWMRINNFTKESLANRKMILIFGLTYFFSFLITVTLPAIVIHKTHAYSMLFPEILEAGGLAQQQLAELVNQYGSRNLNFFHGGLHGGLMGVLFVLPILGIISLFENRGWKYVAFHFGYWFICLYLMGGIVSQFWKYPAPLG